MLEGIVDSLIDFCFWSIKKLEHYKDYLLAQKRNAAGGTRGVT